MTKHQIAIGCVFMAIALLIGALIGSELLRTETERPELCPNCFITAEIIEKEMDALNEAKNEWLMATYELAYRQALMDINQLPDEDLLKTRLKSYKKGFLK